MSSERLRYYKYFFLFASGCLVLWTVMTPSNDPNIKPQSNYIKSLSKMWSNKADEYEHPRVAVILTVSLHKRYLFTLPFTVAAWQKLNVEPIVVIVGDYDVLQTQHQSKVTIDLLLELGARLHFIRNDTTAAPTLSQTSRLFAAALPFAEEYTDDDIFITSDADMIPFHLANHIPNLAANQKLYIYNADCYGNTKVPPARGDYEVPMYSMITLGATVAAWREIMGFNSTNFNGSDIENYLHTEFGQGFFHPTDGEKEDLKSTLIWYADQSLCSYKIAEWFKQDPANRWSTTMTRACARRIDRAMWPAPTQMQNYDLNQWDDAHLIEWGFKEGQWQLFKPLVTLLFKDSEYAPLRERLDKYRADYIAKDCCD
uniref:Glycosyltransferase family 8 protein n=1 Tax=Panagrellus redivivus TaxID=6233 RepID=A0A7E4V334_PANRE